MTKAISHLRISELDASNDPLDVTNWSIEALSNKLHDTTNRLEVINNTLDELTKERAELDQLRGRILPALIDRAKTLNIPGLTIEGEH